MAALTNMEHEYLPVEVEVEAYDSTSIAAVVFRSPPERTIAGGLPPTARYLSLLQTGAHDWGLHPAYCKWLDALPSIDARDRGDAYYLSVEGDKLESWPKMRVGDANNRRKRSSNRGGRKRGHKSNG